MKVFIKFLVVAAIGIGATWGGSELTGFNGGTPWQATVSSVGVLPDVVLSSVDEGESEGTDVAVTAEPLLGQTFDFGSVAFLAMLFGAGYLSRAITVGKSTPATK